MSGPFKNSWDGHFKKLPKAPEAVMRSLLAAGRCQPGRPGIATKPTEIAINPRTFAWLNEHDFVMRLSKRPEPITPETFTVNGATFLKEDADFVEHASGKFFALSWRGLGYLDGLDKQASRKAG